MQEKFELLLETEKQEDETWKDVFTRLDKERGIDLKTVIAVLICIMEELDAKKETKYVVREEEFSTDTSTPDPAITITAGSEESDIHEGAGETEEGTELGSGAEDGGDAPITPA